MTQEEFAERFFVTRQTVSNWEREKSYPDLQTLVKISDEFGISLDAMLKEDTVMVQRIDREIHFGKRGKLVLLVAAILFAVFNVVWFSVWRVCGSKAEDKFISGVSECGFSHADVGYRKVICSEADRSVYFSLPAQKMPPYTDFATDLHAKFLDCYVIEGEEKFQLRWSDGYDKDGGMSVYLLDIKTDDVLKTLSEKESAERIEGFDDLKEEGYAIYESVYLK